MLKAVNTKTFRAGDARFVIIASQYNARYVDAMLRAAKSALRRAGAKQVQVVRVPGAFEIPVVAAHLARDSAILSPDLSHASRITHHASRTTHHRPSAIICLGVILRGQTTHAAHIAEAVSQAFVRIQVQYGIPIIHEVLLLENEEQARARCLDKQHNRGTEAAQTALAMAAVMNSLGSGLNCPQPERNVGA